MSMFGNIAISVVVERLLAFMKKNKNKDVQEQLDLLEKEMQEIKKAADSGWY